MKTQFFSSKYIILSLFLVFIIGASLIVPDDYKINENTRVNKLLATLGIPAVDHFPKTDIFGVSAKRGKAIVHDGFSSRPGGGTTRRQSKHFVCTSCHNVEREDPDLRISDPQARLEYTNKKGLPFLQATSLYGAVNRDSFYNGDYYKKYGDLVIPARGDIREAIQLCAVECAQGRKLKKWELESILAYLWTIDLKLKDLNLNGSEIAFIEKAAKNKTKKDSAATIILSKYKKSSPATFGTAQDSKEAVAQLEGNPDNGKLIYDNSCMHCHNDRRYSFYSLDYDKLTFKHLEKKAHTYGNHSIYQVARFGIYSKSGKRSYMPQYPMEKMSDQQLADLHSFIKQQAAG